MLGETAEFSHKGFRFLAEQVRISCVVSGSFCVWSNGQSGVCSGHPMIKSHHFTPSCVILMSFHYNATTLAHLKTHPIGPNTWNVFFGSVGNWVDKICLVLVNRLDIIHPYRRTTVIVRNSHSGDRWWWAFWLICRSVCESPWAAPFMNIFSLYTFMCTFQKLISV